MFTSERVKTVAASHEATHGSSAVPTTRSHIAGAGDGASALEAGMHETALDAQMAGASVGTGTLKADAIDSTA